MATKIKPKGDAAMYKNIARLSAALGLLTLGLLGAGRAARRVRTEELRRPGRDH